MAFFLFRRGLGVVLSLSIALATWSCSEVNSTDEEGERIKASGQIADTDRGNQDLRTDEPVMTGGAFLFCAYYDRSGDASPEVGCRIQNEKNQKITLQDLLATDLALIRSLDGTIADLDVSFSVASGNSFWHWTSFYVSNEQYRIRLQRDLGVPIVNQVTDIQTQVTVDPNSDGRQGCLGTPFANSCLRLSQSGQSCLNACLNFGGERELLVNLFEPLMCRDALDYLGVDSSTAELPRPLPITIKACGFSAEPLSESLAAGRYVGDVADDVGNQSDDESILTNFRQVCSCRW